MSAAGRVCTGFSKPYVAKYSVSSGTVSYTSGMQLARGVSVNLNPSQSDNEKFYADNAEAEAGGGRFTGGNVQLTVDGLLTAAEALIMGTPAAGTDGWRAYNDDQSTPYVGIGYIARYMQDGVESWVPTVLAKGKFQQMQMSHATQEDNMNFQTQQLTADLFRAEDAKHSWKYVGEDFDTEAEAEAALKTKLGIA